MCRKRRNWLASQRWHAVLSERMVKRAEPLLAKGGTFLAVGAMHLPGQEGIVELLRARGYRVTPVLAT